MKRIQDVPFNPARWPFFYGWMILGTGTLGMLMSVPGQTVGVSVFTDFLIKALGLSRSSLSLAYLVGTVGSALVLSTAGRLYDRRGARAVGVAAGAGLALTLVGLSFSPAAARAVRGLLPGIPAAPIAFVVISVGFFLVRFLGQGMLTLSSRNMVMEWFEKRRGMANAVMGVSISFGFSYSPRVFNALIDRGGWQHAWRVLAAVLAGFAVIAFLLYRDKPEDHGLVPDGGNVRAKRRTHPETAAAADFTLRQALRTYSFWIFALSLVLAGMVITAFTFHIVSIFGDADMSRARAVAVFFPASIVAVILQFTGSWASDYIRLKWMAVTLLAGVAVLAASVAWLTPGPVVLVLILGQGMTQGMIGIVSNVTWPRFFGRRHLGAISGLATAMTVGGTALGPFFFSLVRDITGGYAGAGITSALLSGALLLAALRAERPPAPESGDRPEKNTQSSGHYDEP